MTTPSVTGFAYARDAIPTVGTTAERDARYASPPRGFKVYNGELGALQIWNGSTWGIIGDGTVAYGLALDGVTDDSGALQAAITATPSGGLLVVPDGDCYLASTIVLTKPITVQLGRGTYTAPLSAFMIGASGSLTGSGVGAGPGGVTLRGVPGLTQLVVTNSWANTSQTRDTTSSALYAVIAKGCDQITIADLGILVTCSGGSNGTYDALGICLRDSDDHAIGTTNFAITGNRVTVAGTGLSSTTRFLGIFVGPPVGSRLQVNGVIAQNQLMACKGRDIEVAYASNVVIQGNVNQQVGLNAGANDFGGGIRIVQGCANIVVSGNAIDIDSTCTTAIGGIQVNGAVQNSDIVIVGNMVRSAASGGYGGIKITNVDGCTIVGNTLHYIGTASTLDGISILASASETPTNILIAANHISGWRNSQIQLAAGGGTDPTAIVIRGNRLGSAFDGSEVHFYSNLSDLTAAEISIEDNVLESRTPVVNLAYGTTVTPDAFLSQSAHSLFRITVTDGVGFTIANPTLSLMGAGTYPAGLLMRFDVYNNSGGSLGTVTFDTLYKLAGSFTAPASGKHRYYAFIWDGAAFREISRSPADIAN